MAVTEAYSGTATIGTTEHSLTTNTAGPDLTTVAGAYQAVLDLNAVANADTFTFRVYEKAIAGSTQRIASSQTFNNAQGAEAAIWVSEPFMLMHGWDMTLKKDGGTDRSIIWSIRKA